MSNEPLVDSYYISIKPKAAREETRESGIQFPKWNSGPYAVHTPYEKKTNKQDSSQKNIEKKSDFLANQLFSAQKNPEKWTKKKKKI